MNHTLRTVLLPILFAAGNASAGVLTLNGVVFTSTYTGNVLTLEIDAANRDGGWKTAAAINGLGIKTVGNFDSVAMTSSTGAEWTLSNDELNAKGCGVTGNGKGNGKGNGNGGAGKICYTGDKVDLKDNMIFTFTFTGSPTLSAPHLKVHFITASGGKAGSLLSEDFAVDTDEVQPPVSSGGTQQGGDKGSSGTQQGGDKGTGEPSGTLEPVLMPDTGLDSGGSAGGDTGQAGGTPTVPPSGDVPEPATLAILGAGLAGFCAARRRKRAQA